MPFLPPGSRNGVTDFAASSGGHLFPNQPVHPEDGLPEAHRPVVRVPDSDGVPHSPHPGDRGEPEAEEEQRSSPSLQRDGHIGQDDDG